MALIDFNTSYIRVKDFTGREVLSTYAFEQTPLTFCVDTTLSQLVSSTSFVSSLCSYTLTNYIPDLNDYSNIKIIHIKYHQLQFMHTNTPVNIKYQFFF